MPSHPLQLLPEVSPSRASEDSTWREIARVLCFVELTIKDKIQAIGAELSINPKRSLDHLFMQWSRKNHSFDTVGFTHETRGVSSSAVVTWPAVDALSTPSRLAMEAALGRAPVSAP